MRGKKNTSGPKQENGIESTYQRNDRKIEQWELQESDHQMEEEQYDTWKKDGQTT